MEHGQDGFNMDIEREYKEYLIKSKIKSLEGLKNIKINEDEEIVDSIEDINSQIAVLSDLLKTI